MRPLSLEDAWTTLVAVDWSKEESQTTPPEYERLSADVRAVMETALLHAYATRRLTIELADLHAAAIELRSPETLATIWRDTAGEVRARALYRSFGVLPKGSRDVVTQLVKLAGAGDLPFLAVSLNATA